MTCVALQAGKALNARLIRGHVSQLTAILREIATFEDDATYQARQFGSELSRHVWAADRVALHLLWGLDF